MKKDLLKEIESHIKLINELKNSQLDEIINISDIIVKCINSKGIVYLCGNGGSAADAQHIAGELVGKFRINSEPFAAVSLSTDTSVLTCIGNDYGFDDIFSRQVSALMRENDLLWVFTTSGKSPNIIKACKEAKRCSGKIIAFTGSGKTELEKLADILFRVNTDTTSVVQEVHQLAYHLICGLIEKKLFGY